MNFQKILAARRGLPAGSGTTGSHSQLTSSDRFYLEVLRAQRVVSALEVEEQALAELLAGDGGEEVCARAEAALRAQAVDALSSFQDRAKHYAVSTLSAQTGLVSTREDKAMVLAQFKLALDEEVGELLARVQDAIGTAGAGIEARKAAVARQLEASTRTCGLLLGCHLLLPSGRTSSLCSNRIMECLMNNRRPTFRS